MKVTEKSIVEILMELEWKSLRAKHKDIYFAKVNVWRDCSIFPEPIKDKLLESREGDLLEFSFKKGELFSFREESVFTIKPEINFNPPKEFVNLKLKLGRFYPLRFFRLLPGIYEGNPYPGRIIFIDSKQKFAKLDANPPLSYYPLKLKVKVEKIYPKERELGGRCRDWIEEAFRIGPGMQARYDDLATDFDLENPKVFLREDESEDIIFYSQPRLIGHIDRLCHSHLIKYYEKILPPKGKILDLMSSYESHLPEADYEVIGLGINAEELKANSKLNDFLVKDLNQDPSLPFEDESFEAVVCDLSIEYVVKPLELLKEIKRILKPGGIVSFSFSNRYFPPKVIRLWVDLQEFERMGYVLELLIIEGFEDLHTYSLRGYPRPENDPWINYTKLSDPLYVVWGKKPLS